MSNKIVLISDDSNFFDYISQKLEMRYSDELSYLSFDDVPENVYLIENSVLIVNSENSQQKTLDLLNLFSCTPIIVIAYNEDIIFKKKCYNAGMLDFIPLLISDSEFRARMIPALNFSSLLEKQSRYRDILVKNGIMNKHNDVFIDYEKIIDNVVEEIKITKRKAVFCAIAPDDRGKFLLKSDKLEYVLLNKIRKTDILMSYAPDKYYIILFDTDEKSVKKMWKDISKQFTQKIYIGIENIKNQNRQKLINSVMNKLYNAYNEGICYNSETTLTSKNSYYSNFKMFRKEFSQKLNNIVVPVFYSIQQKYINKLSGVRIEFSNNDSEAEFNILGKHFLGSFKMSCPGYTKILIDINIKKENEDNDSKRILFEPEELDSTLLNDLLEQFISEIHSRTMQEVL